MLRACVIVPAIADLGGQRPGVAGQTDGNVKIRGSDWSFGFNAGILIEPSPETRLGLAYFYNQAANLSGAAEFERPEVGNVISAVSGEFVQTEAAARLAYPDRLNFGVVHAVSPALDVRAGLAWTLWHSLKELRIHFANPDQPDAVTNDNWRDQLAYAIGGIYKVDPAFVLRAGVSYDPTPVPDATHREPRIPDSDRLMLAIGAGYAWSDETRIDIAYEHIFNNTGSIDVSSPSGDRLSGKTRLSAHLCTAADAEILAYLSRLTLQAGYKEGLLTTPLTACRRHQALKLIAFISAGSRLDCPIYTPANTKPQSQRNEQCAQTPIIRCGIGGLPRYSASSVARSNRRSEASAGEGYRGRAGLVRRVRPQVRALEDHVHMVEGLRKAGWDG